MAALLTIFAAQWLFSLSLLSPPIDYWLWIVFYFAYSNCCHLTALLYFHCCIVYCCLLHHQLIVFFFFFTVACQSPRPKPPSLLLAVTNNWLLTVNWLLCSCSHFHHSHCTHELQLLHCLLFLLCVPIAFLKYFLLLPVAACWTDTICIAACCHISITAGKLLKLNYLELCSCNCCHYSLHWCMATATSVIPNDWLVISTSGWLLPFACPGALPVCKAHAGTAFTALCCCHVSIGDSGNNKTSKIKSIELNPAKNGLVLATEYMIHIW